MPITIGDTTVLSAGNLVLQASSATVATISTGNVTVSGSVTSVNTFGYKNRIINGAMVIDQRNVGNSVTLTTADGFATDRWLVAEDTDGTMTAQRSTTAPAGFTNSLLLTTGTADTSLAAGQFALVLQNIEGYNIADFGWGTASAKTVTLSFWVRSSLTGTFGGSIRNGAGNRSYPFSYTISSANTFEYKTITIPGDTTGTWATNHTVGIRLTFGLGLGSTYTGTAGAWVAAGYLSVTGATSVIGTAGATFYITGVQLELGSAATGFDYRPFQTELVMCQRYFEKTYSYDTRPGVSQASDPTSVDGEIAFRAPSASVEIYVPWKVTKRVAGTPRFYSPATGTVGKLRDNSSAADVDATYSYIGSFGIFVQKSTVGTDQYQYGFHVTVDSEL